MKTKLFLVGLLLSVFGILSAQDNKTVKFEETIHDFGQIEELGGFVTHTFEFKNISKKPIIITNVKASCGCTSPSWTKEPIAPKKKGEVAARFNPNGRAGKFEKNVTVFYQEVGSTESQSILLKIKGEVIPKPKN